MTQSAVRPKSLDVRRTHLKSTEAVFDEVGDAANAPIVSKGSRSMYTAGDLPPIPIHGGSILSEHFTLPTLPVVVDRVRKSIEGEADVAEVARLVSSDATLVPHLLKVVNSAYYALPRKVGDVRFAIAYLGLGEIYRIMLTLSVVRALEPDDRAELQLLWRHAYLTALSAKELSRQFKHIDDVGDLYSAALLHDLGKLVYLRFYPDHYDAIKRYSKSRNVPFYIAEQRLGLPSHRLLGSLLCREWHLPETIRRACSHHEFEDLRAMREGVVEHDVFTVVMALANIVADLAADESPRDRRTLTVALVTDVLDFDHEEFVALMGRIDELNVEAERFLSDLLA